MKTQQQKSISKYQPCPPSSPRLQQVIKSAKYATSQDSRGAIPVFQFEVNGHPILWDSENGFVHFTGIWKALGNSKADIVKIVDGNPDLQVKKVRGGCLTIQGTWMPFESAKALCVNNAWALRFDLVPVFGKSFPNDCCPPGHPDFGSLKVGSDPTPGDSQVSSGLVSRSSRSSRPTRGRAFSTSGVRGRRTKASTSSCAASSASASASVPGPPGSRSRLARSCVTRNAKNFSPYQKASSSRRSARQRDRSLSSASCPSASDGHDRLVSSADAGAACRAAGGVVRARASRASRASSGSPYPASSSRAASPSSYASPSVLSRRRRHCMSVSSLLNGDEEEDCSLVAPSAFSWSGSSSPMPTALPPMVIPSFEGEGSGMFIHGFSGFFAPLPTAKIAGRGLHRESFCRGGSRPSLQVIPEAVDSGSSQQKTLAVAAEIVPLFGPSASAPPPPPMPARLTSQEQDVIERVEAGIALQCLSQDDGRRPKDFFKNRSLPTKVRAGDKVFHVLWGN